MERNRRQQVLDLRIAAAQLASSRGDVRRAQNFDENKFRAQKYLASFSKGLPHDANSGLLRDARDYHAWLELINAPGNRADDGSNTQHWNGTHAGNAFLLAGPDAQSLTIAAAPVLGSAELTTEMAELYLQAQLRDVPLACFTHPESLAATATRDQHMQRLQQARDTMARRAQQVTTSNSSTPSLSAALQRSLKTATLTQSDSGNGPYLSQLLLCGTHSAGTTDIASNGIIVCGTQRIDQRMQRPLNRDYATTWNEWLELQHDADLRNRVRHPRVSRAGDNVRFMTTPRDLAGYVHYATPLRAFTHASLVLLAQAESPAARRDEFAGHILFTALAQAQSCAVAAARFQQFQVHRRLRPEALAARLEKFDHPDVATTELSAMFAELTEAQVFDDSGKLAGRSSRLLPLAWVEGSPLAPSYCSAYAAAAGACATVMKAFFNAAATADFNGVGRNLALLPADDGRSLLPVALPKPLTLAEEIDKLASNLAIGRCWAGVSFYSDVAAGLDLGARVAGLLLEEMRLLQSANAV